MHDQERDLPDDPVLAAAYGRVAQTFALARAFVFDRYPHGLPPREELTPSQRQRLEALELAEAELDALRQARRQQPASCRRPEGRELGLCGEPPRT